MEDRCPLCLKMKEFNIPDEEYLKYQNTERLVCKKCAEEIKGNGSAKNQIVRRSYVINVCAYICISPYHVFSSQL